MAKYLVIIALLIGLNVSAQNDTTKYYSTKDYGWSYRRLQAREALVLPSDTLYNKLGVAVKNGVMYVGNGTSWKASTGGGGDTTSLSNRINGKLSISDSAAMLYKYLRKVDTTSLSNRINGNLSLTGGNVTGKITATTSNNLSAIVGVNNSLDDENRANGIEGFSNLGSGVVGTSNDNTGVEGTSTYGIGIYGLSQNGVGIAGRSITSNHAEFGINKVIIANSGKLTSADTLIGSAIKRTGGSSDQFLMADGSVTTGGGSGTVTSVAPLTITATGDNITSSVVNGTTTPVITLNVPDASATARGVITTGAQTIVGQKTFNPTVTASAGVAQGTVVSPTLNAFANSDQLPALDIVPTFATGAFTGVKKEGIRIPVDFSASDYQIRLGSTTANSAGISSTGPIFLQAQNNTILYANASNTEIMGRTVTSGINFKANDGGATNGRFAPTTGNLLLGTTTDNLTDKLQVTGNIKATGAIIGTNTRTVITAAGVANATTTLEPAGLTTPTLAAGTYRFSILIAYNAATTGTGARFVLDGTGTAPTNLSFSMIRPTGASTQQPNFGSAYLFPGTATAASLTTGNICKIEGVITLPSTAVLSVKFASSTTSAITILPGSYFEYF